MLRANRQYTLISTKASWRPTSSTASLATSFPSLVLVFILTVALALFCWFCHRKKTAVVCWSYDPIAGVNTLSQVGVMYAGHSFDWCITNEANHQGHHSCDNSASKRDTYWSNMQVQEVYYGYSQETHRDPRATTAGNYQHNYQTNITINIYYQQLQNYKQNQENKQTNNYFQN